MRRATATRARPRRTPSTTTALRESPRARARAGAEAAAPPAASRRLPGRCRRPTAPHPRRLRRRDRAARGPAPRATRCGARSTRAPTAGLEAFGIWTAGEVDDGDRLERRRARRSTRVTDAALKVIARDDERPPRLGRAAGSAPTARSTPATSPRAASPRRRARSRSSSSPASTRSCSTPTPSARCSSSSADWRSTGSPHTEGRGALSGALGRARWRRRRSTSPTARAPPARCRARSTPRACPRRRSPLIQDGVAARGRPRHALGGARGRRRRSTGHALAPGGSPSGPRRRTSC